ncbi:MAG TPA: OstA-like protein [Bacteroidales bacterium]|nr:OstA-like protein [Bacteroidales bacterium]
MKHLKLTLLFHCLLLSGLLSAQQRTTIHVERARLQRFDRQLGPDTERLIGNVILRQDSTLFFCDSAHLNQRTRNFEAFGNVHIKMSDSLNIYSNRLFYNGEARTAELFGDVKLVDDTTTLETQYLTYNRLTRLATYPNNGLITSGENKLKSKRGYYRSDLKTFYFAKDVELINPEYTIYNDTMVYNTNTEMAYFYGPTLIRGEETNIYTEYGWYHTGRDQARLTRNNRLDTKQQTITADDIFYDRITGFADANGHVNIADTNNRLIVEGETGKLWENEGRSFVTGKARLLSYDNTDTLYMHADTLFSFFTSEREMTMFKAYYGVRFYRQSIQGQCDSVVYTTADSTMRMYKQPILWSDENQLTADSVFIINRNNRLDSLVLHNNAFIVSVDSIKGFNQIKGKFMIGWFEDNELDRIFVDGNAQTVYWVRESDGTLIGINFAKSSTMRIELENKNIKRILYFSTPTEVMYPEDEMPPEEEKLKGFQWLEELRPLNKNDIFRRN